MRSLEVSAGRVTPVEYDFASEVELRGRVIVRGDSGALDSSSRVQFIRSGEGPQGTGSVRPDGTYSVVIPPGRYMTRLLPGMGEGPVITVDDWPEEQRRDLEFSLNDAEVFVFYPEGRSFSRGHVVIQPRQTHHRYGMTRLEVTQEHRHVPNLIGGEYQATFQSADRQWRGQSGFVNIGAGRENVFEIDVRRVLDGERIGGWDPSTITTMMTNLTFPVGGLVDEPGVYEILIQYERGRHAVETQGASFVVGQASVASALYQGWSGIENYNNAYILHLNEVPQDGSLAVEVILRADGGTDSTGSVFLSRLD